MAHLLCSHPMAFCAASLTCRYHAAQSLASNLRTLLLLHVQRTGVAAGVAAGLGTFHACDGVPVQRSETLPGEGKLFRPTSTWRASKSIAIAQAIEAGWSLR